MPKTSIFGYDCEAGEEQLPLMGPDVNLLLDFPQTDCSVNRSRIPFLNAKFSDTGCTASATVSTPSELASRKDWTTCIRGVSAFLICLLAGSFVFGSSSNATADVGSLSNKGVLDTGLQMMQHLVNGIEETSNVAGDAAAAFKDTQKEWNMLKTEAASYGTVPTLSPAEKASLANQEQKKEASVEKDLTPNEHLNDGNICSYDEELFLSLCYKKCSALTNGFFPLRSAPNQCCSASTSSACDSAHVQTTNTRCGGFEVSGDQEGKSGCPNPPGSCLSNEEAFAGLCYKKCEYLTQGIYPFRSGPESCCKLDPTSTASTGFACFLGALNQDSKTNLGFGIGGGAGDRTQSTPDFPHPPSLALTEYPANT